MNPPLRLISWNVNGLRACAKKGFADWLKCCDAQLVGVQEVRALPEQLPPEIARPDQWHTAFCPATRKGYSGVGLFARTEPDTLETSLGDEGFDAEGRLQLARWGRLWVANVYFPNGSGKNRDHSRVPFKLDFYRALFERLRPELEAGGRAVVMGDFNTAHREIDLARPKENQRTSGFLPEERAEFDRWIQAGWIDTFRALHPDTTDVYSWWSQRFGVRERNVGWRIDYVLASPGAMPFVHDAFILGDVMGSDHCPVGVDLDPSVLR